MTECKQCGDEMTTDALPFCTYCLHDGIDAELRHLLPPNGNPESEQDEADAKPETEQSGLGGYA